LDQAALFDALCAALETHARARDDDPWPYFLLALACDATGRDRAAQGAVAAFKQRTDDPSLHERIDALLTD